MLVVVVRVVYVVVVGGGVGVVGGCGGIGVVGVGVRVFVVDVFAVDCVLCGGAHRGPSIILIIPCLGPVEFDLGPV